MRMIIGAVSRRTHLVDAFEDSSIDKFDLAVLDALVV